MVDKAKYQAWLEANSDFLKAMCEIEHDRPEADGALVSALAQTLRAYIRASAVMSQLNDADCKAPIQRLQLAFYGAHMAAGALNLSTLAQQGAALGNEKVLHDVMDELNLIDERPHSTVHPRRKK